jgi:predicted Zn-dependent peptidase
LAEFHRAVLPSGVVVVAERHPHVRSVCLGLWVRVGSRDERADEPGVSHFIEHMTFKGTRTMGPLEIATALESGGGDLNAFTDREFTCYHATFLKEHLGKALDVVSELVLEPTFPIDQLERERNVLLQELAMVEDSPEEWLHDKFFELAFPQQPFGLPVIGTRQLIKSLSRERLKRFHRAYYRPDNFVLSVAGNVEFAELVALATKAFPPQPAAKRPTNAGRHRRRARFQSSHRSFLASSEQTHLLVGYEGVSFADPDRFPALVLSVFLGGGMSSRLFQEVREKAGLAYGVDCDMITFTDTGLLTISVSTHPRTLDRCVAILRRELERLRDEALDATSIEMVKSQLRGTILLGSDQMESRQESLARNEIVFGRYVPVEAVLDEIDRVTPERVRRLAQRVFQRKRETVVALGRRVGPTRLEVMAS